MKRLAERIALILLGVVICAVSYHIGVSSNINANESVSKFDVIECSKIIVSGQKGSLSSGLIESGQIIIVVNDGRPEIHMTSVDKNGEEVTSDGISLFTGNSVSAIIMDTDNGSNDNQVSIMTNMFESSVSINDTKVLSSLDNKRGGK